VEAIGLRSEVPRKRNSIVLQFEGCAWDPQPNQVKVKHAKVNQALITS